MLTSEDLPYQIYVGFAQNLYKSWLMLGKDSLQAFSSSIAGMLSSRAVLEGKAMTLAQVAPEWNFDFNVANTTWVDFHNTTRPYRLIMFNPG